MLKFEDNLISQDAWKGMELWQGDCLELMPDIEDGSVDVVIADPPYGTTACKWDSIIPLEPMWKKLKKLIKPNRAIVFTASQPFTSNLVMSNPKWFKYCWVWCKNRATGHVHAKNKPMKQHEDICVFSGGNTLHSGQSKKRMPYFPQGLTELPKGTKRRTRNDAGDNAVMGSRKSHKETECTHTGYPKSLINFSVDVNNGNRYHTTQKPIALMEYLIKTYTNEGDTVLDFCMGSGTTGVACQNLNRNFIGIEKDPKYFEIATNRIKPLSFQQELS